MLDGEQIRADLRTMIGGTDAAAVMNASPWRSAYQVWAEKTGRIIPDPKDDVERFYWGKRLEPLIREEYQIRTGREVVQVAHKVLHPDHDFIGGHLDGLIRGEPGIFEAKNVSGWEAKEWTEDPPTHYMIQGQHYLLVTGANYVDYAALIGGCEFRWCRVKRNQKFIDSLLKAEVKFWTECVLADREPSVDGHAATKAALAAMYPQDNGETVNLPDDFFEWDSRYVAAKAALNEAEKEKREAENHIKAALKEAERGILPDGTFYTYKTQKDGKRPLKRKEAA